MLAHSFKPHTHYPLEATTNKMTHTPIHPNKSTTHSYSHTGHNTTRHHHDSNTLPPKAKAMFPSNKTRWSQITHPPSSHGWLAHIGGHCPSSLLCFSPFFYSYYYSSYCCCYCIYCCFVLQWRSQTVGTAGQSWRACHKLTQLQLLTHSQSLTHFLTQLERAERAKGERITVEGGGGGGEELDNWITFPA